MTCYCLLGEEIAFYFGWMCFYLKFICAPLVIGLAMYAFRPRGITVDTDPYLPFFSVVMALWGVLFVVVSSPSHCVSIRRTPFLKKGALVASALHLAEMPPNSVINVLLYPVLAASE